MIQLHSSTLLLAIETGGFNGLPEETRLCLLCNGEVIFESKSISSFAAHMIILGLHFFK